MSITGEMQERTFGLKKKKKLLKIVQDYFGVSSVNLPTCIKRLSGNSKFMGYFPSQTSVVTVN